MSNKILDPVFQASTYLDKNKSLELVSEDSDHLKNWLEQQKNKIFNECIANMAGSKRSTSILF
jgi:hypothetical protein